MARLSPDNVRRAKDLISLYPQSRSALIPMLHVAQEQDGWLTPEAMEHVGELLGITPAEVYGTATFYDMLFTEGFKVPEGEVYVAIESPRGELGCYMVSDGSSKPYRMHIRGPSFVNLQALAHMIRGGLLADAVAIISTVDPVMGEVDR